MDWENKPPFGIHSAEQLGDIFHQYCETQLRTVCLSSVISKQRISDAFNSWKEDLNRSKSSNFRSNTISPDHIKAAAHLTYWIRRTSPIIDLKSVNFGMYDEISMLIQEVDNLKTDALISIAEGEDLSSHELRKGMNLLDFTTSRERAFAYGNELFAFEFGFNHAKSYEEQKQFELGHSVVITSPNGAYIEDFCYFLKFKSVSPHAIDLIYRALLKIVN